MPLPEGFTPAGASAGAPTGTEQEPTPERDEASTVGQLAALAGNSAMFGLAPKAAWAVGRLSSKEKADEYEQGTREYLQQGREDNPILGVIAEIAGGLAVPVPGVGAVARGAAALVPGTRVLGTAARGLVQGALHGGAEGAIRGASGAYGEGGTEGLGTGLETAIEGGTAGGLGGLAFGGALGGLGGAVAGKAQSARAAATGGGAESARRIERMSLSRKPGAAWESAKSGPLVEAEELRTPQGKRIMGGLFQSSDEVFSRARDAAEAFGKGMENVAGSSRAPQATRRPAELLGLAIDLVEPIEKSHSTTPDARKAASQFSDWVLDSVRKNSNYTPLELHNLARNISADLVGQHQSRIPADNIFNSLKKQYAYNLRQMVKESLSREDAELARQYAQHSKDFHAAATVRDMAKSSVPRWDLVKENILGKGAMSQLGTAVMTHYGMSPVPARAISQAMSAPGVLPNTYLFADRLRRAGLEPLAKMSYKGVGLPPWAQNRLIPTLRRASTAGNLGGLLGPMAANNL